jgi:hypothetical protein
MALAIPIISTFDGGGVSKAINEFKKLEGAGQESPIRYQEGSAFLQQQRWLVSALRWRRRAGRY